MPVRLGLPQYVTGLGDVIRNPAYATGVGLLLFGRQHGPHGERGAVGEGGFKRMLNKMKSWFQGNF